jgi:hypothetical protein
MSSTVRIAAIACVLIALRTSSGEEPDEPADLDVPALIELLDAENFTERQRAMAKLMSAGEQVLPAVREALHHDSAEVRYRARHIVETLTRPQLYTISGEGVLYELKVHKRDVELRVVRRLGRHFRPPNVTTGLAMSRDKKLYAAVNTVGDERPARILSIELEAGDAELIVALSPMHIDGLCFATDDLLYAVTSQGEPGASRRRSGAGKLLAIDVRRKTDTVVGAKIGCGDLDALAINSHGHGLVTVGKRGFYEVVLDGQQRISRCKSLGLPQYELPECGQLEGLTYTHRDELYALLLGDDGKTYFYRCDAARCLLEPIAVFDFSAKNLTCAPLER